MIMARRRLNLNANSCTHKSGCVHHVPSIAALVFALEVLKCNLCSATGLLYLILVPFPEITSSFINENLQYVSR
jgi:hypothetical protein